MNIDQPDAVLVVKNDVSLEKLGTIKPGRYHLYNMPSITHPTSAIVPIIPDHKECACKQKWSGDFLHISICPEHLSNLRKCNKSEPLSALSVDGINNIMMAPDGGYIVPIRNQAIMDISRDYWLVKK